MTNNREFNEAVYNVLREARKEANKMYRIARKAEAHNVSCETIWNIRVEACICESDDIHGILACVATNNFKYAFK